MENPIAKEISDQIREVVRFIEEEAAPKLAREYLDNDAAFSARLTAIKLASTIGDPDLLKRQVSSARLSLDTYNQVGMCYIEMAAR